MSSFTIGKKLSLGVGALGLTALAFGISTLASSSAISERVHNIVDSTSKKQAYALELQSDDEAMLSAIRGLEVRGFMKDSEMIEKYHSDFNTQADASAEVIENFTPLAATADAKQLLEQLRASAAAYRASGEDAYRNARAGNMDGAVQSYTAILPIYKARKAQLIALLAIERVMLEKDKQATLAQLENSRTITFSLLALTALVAAGMIFVVRQTNRLLRGTVQELASASVQIASAANQVSSSSQSLASGSSQQAATIEETSSASSEINSMAQRTTVSARETAEIVTRSQKDVEATRNSLDEMVLAMEDISSSSQKISKIIKVIDEIAFQTNILALNAAVEAARAGEAGMGFAVVADEVRNLAQRCAQAAKDTTDLIDDSIQKSAGGKAKVDQVAVAIRAITAESTRIKTLIDDISLGSVEQSRGIDQIAQAITQMEQVTQTGAANAEETAAAAEQLHAQAAALEEIVERLQVAVAGSKTDAPGVAGGLLGMEIRAKKPVQIASFRTAVSFPAKKSVASSKPRAVTATALKNAGTRTAANVAEFPLDDDFKEF